MDKQRCKKVLQWCTTARLSIVGHQWKEPSLEDVFLVLWGLNNEPVTLFRQTTSVIRKEIQVAFASPLVYVFWFVASLLVGLFFYLGLVVSPEPNSTLLTVNVALPISC